MSGRPGRHHSRDAGPKPPGTVRKPIPERMPRMKRDSLVQLPRALTEPRRDPDARFVMGIDGGATKTLAAVLDLRANVLHLGHSGPSNEDAVGAEKAVQALLAAADEATA